MTVQSQTATRLDGLAARSGRAVLVDGPDLAALCVLAAAAIEGLEDLSPAEVEARALLQQDGMP